MNDLAPSPHLEQTAEPPSVANTPSRYIIVSQVKSNRVVYFTDDPDYRPPMDGDWYYVSTYQGALPEAMTLRNCWGWRFNGGVFQSAGDDLKQSTAEALLENNRKVLLRLLREKIDAVRQPFLPSCAQGDVLRQIKRQEALAYLAHANPTPGQQSFPMLHNVAVARNCTLLEAAKLIIAKAEETERVLLESERFREQMALAIAQCRDEKTLWELREWLLDKIYPELTRQFKYRIEDTEPIDLDAPIGGAHRQYEILRLKVQLRESVNRLREPLRSDYLGNEEMRRHKAILAQSLLENGGDKRDGLDYTALDRYAEARALPLPDAAQMLLDSFAAGRELLMRTELVKDRLLARIDAIRTLRDIEEVERSIGELGMETKGEEE